jgi:hypothetical protein
MNTPLGVLRTAPQEAEDEPGRFGDQAPPSWDLIPGRKSRNDGCYPATLVPGYTYHLAHDGIGWLFSPEGERPHAYLVDGDLQPVGLLELAHRAVVLDRASRYTIERDETGAWRLLEHAGLVV